MIQHHPSDSLLVEFATGTLDTAQAIAINAHLHFCTKCQQNIQKMEQTGGVILNTIEPQALSEDSFDKLLLAIDDIPDNLTQEQPISSSEKTKEVTKNKSKLASETARVYGQLPNIVAKMISNQAPRWRHINSSLKTGHLIAGQNIHQVSLQKISAGGVAPEHDHCGTEMTVVLKGSFSDKDGIYQEGDFILKGPGDVHQPISARNQDCLCLSVESAPVKLTGLLGRVINPFIKHNAA